MDFSAFMFTKNTVRCVGLLELLGMVFFTLSKFTKDRKKAVGLIALAFFTFKAKGRVEASDFSPSNSPMAMAAGRVWARA